MTTGPPSSSSGPPAPALPLLGEAWCHVPWRGRSGSQPWAAGPDAVSPLFLQLPGAEGAVGGHAAGVSRGDAPGAAARGNAAPQLGRGAPAAAGSSWAQLPDKREEAAWGSPSSLPVPSRCTGHQKEPREPE